MDKLKRRSSLMWGEVIQGFSAARLSEDMLG